MKTLFPAQQKAHDFFKEAQLKGLHTLDTSDVGTGKTIVACSVASSLGKPVAVVCPKAVIPSWERELKEMGVPTHFVLNYEKLRGGRTKWLSKRGKKAMTWHLPKDTLLLFDEVHKCKAMYSQNAQLLISAVAQRLSVHCMSATAAKDPTEMRALGYALGEHSLQRGRHGRLSYYGWLKAHGCSKDPWSQWAFTRNPQKAQQYLSTIGERIYKTCAARLTVADFPDSFKANHVIYETVQFKDHAKILKAYKDLGITPAIVEDYLENGIVEDSEYVLVNILRARQLAESYKLRDYFERAQEFIEDHNKSVVLFVNFAESAEWLHSAAQNEGIPVGMVVGGQSTKERQDAVDGFQSDELRLLVVNIQAGGTGLSLHDLHGKHPRVSLISPSFNEKDFAQALGRIYRNGAKSDALQYVLIAEGSVEETVCRAVRRKISCIKSLHFVKD